MATEILEIANREAWVDDKVAALDATMDAILSEAARKGVSPADVAQDVVARAITERAA